MKFLLPTTFRNIASGRVMLNCYLIAALLYGHSSLAEPQRSTRQDLPLQAIVCGHHVQPRQSQLLAIGRPDVTRAEAAEVEQLYQELMRCALTKCAAQTRSGN
jgi:hypothetical protein